MRRVRRVEIPLVLLCIASVPAGARAQSGTVVQQGIPRQQALQLLSSGSRWAVVKGTMQPDGNFLTREMDIVAPTDSLNMKEMEITGVIRALDRRLSTMTLGNYKVLWNEQTKITDMNKNKILSSKLENETGLKATGRLQPDGTFLARKLRQREAKQKGGETKFKEEFMGPVQVINAGQGQLRVMRTMIRLKPDCEFYDMPVELRDDSQ
jgi:uncharacterized protein DUF5666